MFDDVCGLRVVSEPKPVTCDGLIRGDQTPQITHPTEGLPNGLATVAFQVVSDREFATQLELCYRPLRGLLRFRFGNSISADDVAQDAMALAWEKRARFDPSRGSLLKWLYAIAWHLVMHELRQRRRRPEPRSLGEPRVENLLAKCVPSPDEQHETSRLRYELERSLDRLPARQRDAVILHHGLRQSLSDTARAMDITRRQVFRATATGRKRLSDELRRAENSRNLRTTEDSR